MKYLVTPLVLLFVTGCPGPDPCPVSSFELAENEVSVDEAFSDCDSTCGTESCQGDAISVVGFPEFANTYDPDNPGSQSVGQLWLSSSDFDDYGCMRSTITIGVEEGDGIEDLFRSIHATRSSEDQFFGDRAVHVTGLIQAYDRPTSFTCRLGHSIVANGPDAVHID
jgi:hypothetical protein